MAHRGNHWGTTDDLHQIRWPTHDNGTGLTGRPLGWAARGGPFYFDPFDAYEAGLVANPNMIVAGAIGVGKSTIVKMMLGRALDHERRVVVIDPKGEYGAFAEQHHARHIVLGRDGWCSPFSGHDSTDYDILRSLVGAVLGSALNEAEDYALDMAWRRRDRKMSTRVLRAVWRELKKYVAHDKHPAERRVALALRRLVQGDLAATFDGPGPPLTLDDPLVVLDISQHWAQASLPPVAICAVACAQRVASETSRGYVVIDEAWALLAEEQALRWLQGSWKLARARGVSHCVVLHRWSDIGAVGNAGSAARARAQGLLRECETAWLFRQPPDETLEMTTLLGLHAREAEALTHLPRGVALVRYGEARSIVTVAPDDSDRRVIDTDAAMRALTPTARLGTLAGNDSRRAGQSGIGH